MAGQRNSYGKRSHSHSDYDNGRNKRRHSGDDRDREQFVIDSQDTVYRYLCPVKKIGSIIGRGGEIVKQLRTDTKAKIRIGETVRGSDDRVVTIYSANDETNAYGDSGDYITPAQDALFRVHDRVIAEDNSDDDAEGGHHVTARLLVRSDQIGSIIGKGGQIVQNIRTDTGAQIRILKDEHLPSCALSSDELVQISGEAAVVKKALYQIASRLHENPSRSQHLLFSAVPSVFPAASSLMGPNGGAPIVGIAPLMSPYGGYRGDVGDWSRSLYSAPRDELSSKEFSLRIVCATGNIGGVIGKGGAIINQIRQESRALIKVDSSASEGDDCLIDISAKEYFDDHLSPTIEAALRLQPRCSDKIERDSGIISFSTRLLVPTKQIGCLLGKRGAIINEMRNLTKANIRILGKDDLPKVASKEDEMVQISGDLDVAKDALLQVSRRLRANVFDREGAVSTFLPVMPYLPVPADGSDGLGYDSRDSKREGRGHSYSSRYGSNDYPAADHYGSYSNSQIGSSGGAYGAYGDYASGRTTASGLSSQAHGSRRRNYY
ncbi:RNA-binding KH domain-containing protein [Euphorbia peplus]|nr:RNA-binding KH domain-containing protein [Euphorbia peplus]